MDAAHNIANGMIENFPLKGFSSKESGKKRENLRLLKQKSLYFKGAGV